MYSVVHFYPDYHTDASVTVSPPYAAPVSEVRAYSVLPAWVWLQLFTGCFCVFLLLLCPKPHHNHLHCPLPAFIFTSPRPSPISVAGLKEDNADTFSN